MGLLDRLRRQPAPQAPTILHPGITAARTLSVVMDEAGTSAIDLDKISDAGCVDLAKHAEVAQVNLEKNDLAGIRATGVLILDQSGSMRADYENGNVQLLVARILGFMLNVDPDGYVTIIPFDSRAGEPIKVGWKANPKAGIHSYVDIVDREIWKPNRMGSTNLAAALGVVERDILPLAKLPVYLAVATDGAPDSEPLTTDRYCELSRWPDFIKNLSLRPVRYLQMLDESTSLPRLVDNCNSQPDKEHPRLNLLSCTDDEFYQAMTAEWADWFSKAKDAGILT